MAKKTAKEIMEKVTSLLPDATSDDALALFEDINDSIVSETEDWKQKYEDNDKAWRQRYHDRFMGTSDDDGVGEEERHEEVSKPLTYESLFE